MSNIYIYLYGFALQLYGGACKENFLFVPKKACEALFVSSTTRTAHPPERRT